MIEFLDMCFNEEGFCFEKIGHSQLNHKTQSKSKNKNKSKNNNIFFYILIFIFILCFVFYLLKRMVFKCQKIPSLNHVETVIWIA